MRILQPVGAWIKQRALAFLFALAFVVAGVVLITPYQESTFILQTRVKALAALMQGGFVFLLLPLAESSLALYVAALCVVWGVAGLVVQRLWRGNLGERVIVILFLAGNALFLGGPQAAGLIGAGNTKPVECEYFASDANGVRVVAYPTGAESNQFYLATQDGGERWSQFMYGFFRGRQPECDRIKSLGSDLIWLWNAQTIAVTRDGGATWQIRDLGESWPGWDPSYGNWTFDHITFTDAQNGELALFLADQGIRRTVTLATDDGGLTWREAEGDVSE